MVVLAVALGVALVPPAGAKTAAKSASAKGTSSARSKSKPKPKAGADTSAVLFRIGHATITSADVQKRLDELPEGVRPNYTTPEGRRQLLDRMVEERVWMMAAEGAGVPTRPKVVQQLEQQRRDLIIRTYLAEVMAANPAPSDSEARIYYDAHIADYKIPATASVRHIQTKKQNDAKRVLQWARSGQDWNKLCARYSTDSLTRTNGGSLGTITREGQFQVLGRQPALAETVFAIGAGKFGGPCGTERGWHVLKVDEVKPESVRPFDQVRPTIVRQLSGQRSQDFYRTKLDETRRMIGVEADSAAIKRYLAQKKDAREMFKEAQEKGAPEQRIAAYRQLLETYPQSEVSAQAAFMVGFIYSEELKNYEEAERAFRELLGRYPKSELAASAKWMVDHMRTDEAPPFVEMQADSITGAAHPDSTRPRGGATKGRANKP